MKTFINLIFYFFILSCLSSCGQSPKTGAENEGITVVQIDPTREDEVSAFDFFSDIRLIPLEGCSPDAFLTSELFGLIVTGEYILVLDRRVNKILCFDADGKWLETVDKNGQGYGEFSLSSDFILDRRDSTLVVLDPRGKILKYAVEPGLPLIKQFDISSYVRATHKLTTLNEKDFLLYSDSEDQPMFVFESESQSCCPVDYHRPSWLSGIYSYTKTPFLPAAGSICFYEGLDGDLFQFNEFSGDLTKILHWDFGKYNFDIKKLEANKDTDDYLNFWLSNSDRVVTPVYIKCITESVIFMHFFFKKAWKHVVYDRESETYVCFSSFKEGGIFEHTPGSGHPDREYLLITPEIIHKAVSREMLRDTKSLQAFDNMKDTDNHYLVEYILK